MTNPDNYRDWSLVLNLFGCCLASARASDEQRNNLHQNSIDSLIFVRKVCVA